LNRIIGLVTLAIGLTACGSAGDSDKVERLERKVMALERRVKSLETRGGRKGPPNSAQRRQGNRAGKPDGVKPNAAQPKSNAPVDKGKVRAQGDARRVALLRNGKKFSLPSEVPVGDYKILAAFGEDKPVEAGTVSVAKEQAVTITCSAETKTCK